MKLQTLPSALQADPAASRSLTSMLFERLRADIVAARLRPNEKLRISALCQRYGVTSSAVREALSRLVSDGLVQAEAHKGFTVSPVSRAGLRDLTRTRIQIETLALRQAIELGDLAWQGRVLSAFHQLAGTPDPRADSADAHIATWLALHRQFHHALIDACESDWLLYFAGLLGDQSERYRNLSGRLGDAKPRDLLAEHRSLMDAVLARDADAACSQLERHFSDTARVLLELDDDAATDIFDAGA